MLNKLAMLSLPVWVLSSSLVVASPDEYDDEYAQRGPMSFEAMDLNKDGVITREEHEEACQKRQESREKQGYPMRNKKDSSVFDEMDTDGDGVLSAEEWANSRQYRGR